MCGLNTVTRRHTIPMGPIPQQAPGMLCKEVRLFRRRQQLPIGEPPTYLDQEREGVEGVCSSSRWGRGHGRCHGRSLVSWHSWCQIRRRDGALHLGTLHAHSSLYAAPHVSTHSIHGTVIQSSSPKIAGCPLLPGLGISARKNIHSSAAVYYRHNNKNIGTESVGGREKLHGQGNPCPSQHLRSTSTGYS